MPRNNREKLAENKPTPECIVCSERLGDSHQLVFDEVGVELELPKLLMQCFDLKVIKDSREIQAVCENCLNDLVETVDIQEKEVEDRVAHGLGPGTSQESITEFQEGNDDFEDEDDSSDAEYQIEVLDGTCDGELKSPLQDMYKQDDSFSSTEQGDSFVQIKAEVESEDDNFYENVDYLDDATQNFDFRTYKALSLQSKYSDIVFPSDIICQLCTGSFTKHTNLMEHIQKDHSVDGFAYTCVLSTSCQPMENLDDLAYHLLYKHYNLNKLSLYLKCPSCSKRFSSFPLFNKHSCYDTKSCSRTSTQCETCENIFQSNRRYRFHLQFHLPNHRPRGCMICDKLFDDENELYEHIFYSHEEDIGLICTRCDLVFTSKENLSSHKKTHKVLRPFKCQMCPKSYLYNQQLKDHVLAHHSQRKSFECPICGKHLFKQTLLNKHIMSHEKKEEREVTVCSECGFVGDSEEDTEAHIKKHADAGSESCLGLMNIDVAYCCEYCEMAFYSIETLRNHRDTHTKIRFYCNMCPLAYDEYKKLKTHKLTHVDYVDQRKTFPVMRHYVCDVPECSQSYMQWTTLRSHKKSKHSNKSVFNCPQCTEEFTDPIKFNQHLQTVHGGAVHTCQFCSKTFSSKMAISVHIARKHNTTKIKCQQCNSVFNNEQYHEKHVSTLHCPVQCSLCDRVMKNLKTLFVHERTVHSKEKRYFCSYCNKGYYNHCDVVEHEEAVHKKIRRYQCTECDYKAVYKQTLTIHMRSHTNEAPYQCDICPKAFRRAYGLSLHLRRHFNIRNFVCPFEGCGSAYPNQGILNSHLRAKHPNGENNVQRKRRTIAIDQDNLFTENKSKKERKPRRRFDVPYTNVFVDDDDGLDDGVIGAPQPNTSIVAGSSQLVEDDDEENVDNPDDSVTYIIDTAPIHTPTTVIIQHNSSDHDYTGKSDDSTIYGNVIEEYEVVTAEIRDDQE